MTYLLGIDLGTSSVKVALIEVDTFRVVAVATQEYVVKHPHPGYAEQDPEDWWRAVVDAIHLVMKDHNPDSVKDKIELLNEIALELIRYRLDIPYKGSPKIETLLNSTVKPIE